MKQKIILSILSLTILSLVVFVSAQQNWAGEGATSFYKGWNLVYGLQSPEQLDAGWLEQSDVKAIYAFNPKTQEYLRAWPNPDGNAWENLDNSIDDHELLQTAFWVYSTKTVEGDLNGVPHATEYWLYDMPELISERPLYKGWNFVGITPDMFDKNLNELKGSCDIASSYAWGANRQSWYVIDLDGVKFVKEMVGQGIVIQVSNDCSLGETSVPQLPDNDVEPIPTLPNGEQKCTDSDGGKNIYVKGIISGISLTNQITTETDFCVEGNLIEFFCNDETNNITPLNRINNNGVPCPTGYTCSDGACVQ